MNLVGNELQAVESKDFFDEIKNYNLQIKNFNLWIKNYNLKSAINVYRLKIMSEIKNILTKNFNLK